MRLPLAVCGMVALTAAPSARLATGTQTAPSARPASSPRPAPLGTLVDIGGSQHLHVNCTGRGSPVVILESGSGDMSVVWSLVQPLVAASTRVCSYDRAGYAWSDPGREPRTFAQLALELHTALGKLKIAGPYVIVGQSYGGLVVRGFAAAYRSEVAGMVLVDAVHEDQHIVYGGASHLIRGEAKGRAAPAPAIELNREALAKAAAIKPAPIPKGPLEAPLDKLPLSAQQIWRWAASQPLLQVAVGAELDWSPEEFVKFHDERLTNRATLGSMPLAVLSRTHGGFPDGLSMTSAQLEDERTRLQADLAGLSSAGTVTAAPHAGHNIHLEDPKLVADAILSVVTRVALLQSIH